jgi:hypothetical protein
MANTLTGLIPHAYAALNVVSRELVGVIPSASRNGEFDRAAVGQDVKIPVAPGANVSDITPAMQTPNPTDQSIGARDMKIQKSRAAEFGYTGEETRQLNSGPGYLTVQAQQILEGVRALTNEIEMDAAKEAAMSASRAWGVAGTTPFTAGVGDSAQVRKILDDNGAPLTGRHMAISTSTGAALRTLNMLNKVNEGGETTMLRQGVLGNLHGSDIRETGAAYNHTAGTGTGYLANGALAKGATVITADTGTGTILAGDVVTFAGSTDKYVVATDLAAGSFTINAPGLVEVVPDNAAITVEGDYSANVNFTGSSLVLATRLPDLPEEGDSALDRFSIQDPHSGLVFELAVYPGYRKNRYEVGCSWGVKGIKPEHAALLLG